MQWTLPNDNTPPIFTAEKHLRSTHARHDVLSLPTTCVIFETSMAMPFVDAHYSTITLSENLPCFLNKPKCISIASYPDVCFTQGGFGAPAAVDTLETVRALGVKRIIVVGMCGGFSANINVGDIVIPSMVLCEEGTSHHYYSEIEFAFPNKHLHAVATSVFSSRFTVIDDAIVTTDAICRETFAKEAYWRQKGCVGVDMESSALLSVSKYYHVPAVSILICSDKHPVSENDPDWEWGNAHFKQAREEFVVQAVSFATQLPPIKPT